MRRAVLLALLLVLPVTAGCLEQVREQKTTILFFLDASDRGWFADFSFVEIVLTHVVFKPNETGVQPVGLQLGKRVDLVSVYDAGPQKLAEADILYRVYDRVSIGVNVTSAIKTDGEPVTVLVPQDNLYFVHKPFRTRLANEVAYYFTLGLEKDAKGQYFLQSRPDESGARRG